MNKTFLLPVLLLLWGCPAPQPPDASLSSREVAAPPLPPADSPRFTPPKNIILMIGDGMGITQITAGMYINGNRLHLEEFSFIGLQKTHASNHLITDSAASGTAMASGAKTYNGAIGVDEDGKRTTTILEQAEARNMASGLVVTSSITHATPACFYAHQKERTMREEIANDLLNSGVDFFVGGGRQYFTKRKDGRNLLSDLEQKGYALSDSDKAGFKDIAVSFDKKFGYFTADEEPKAKHQGRDYFVQAVKTATTYLSSQGEEGFFLMVEGSQIDWGGHAKDSDYIISEMIEFDEAISVALDFAKSEGETLIIVTGDHETGGYAINPGSKMDSIVPAFTTDKHTAVLIPVFAWGPGAELFTGIYDNTAIYEKMKKALGI